MNKHNFKFTISIFVIVLLVLMCGNKKDSYKINETEKTNEQTSKQNQSEQPRDNNQENRDNTTVNSNEQTNVELPLNQKQFVEIVESYYSKYNQAPNELKKSSLRKDRKANLKKIIPKLNISNWIGILKDSGTTGDGDAYITISVPGSNIEIKTWNNSFSDMDDNTLIKNGSNLYNTIAELNNGDNVVFSGTFISDSDDYIEESSLTEDGSMTEPEFMFRFSKIAK